MQLYCLRIRERNFTRVSELEAEEEYTVEVVGPWARIDGSVRLFPNLEIVGYPAQGLPSLPTPHSATHLLDGSGRGQYLEV